MKYIEVLFNLPINRTFTYAIPDEIENEYRERINKKAKNKGNPENLPLSYKFKRVFVSFGNTKETGLIINEMANLDPRITYPIKPVIKIIDDHPVIYQSEYDSARWIAANFFSSLGEAAFLFFPKAKKSIPVEFFGEKSKNSAGETLNKDFPPIRLTEDQKTAYLSIEKSINNYEYKSFLLFGVTGSGKTEIYFKIIEFLLKKNKQTVLLIPEIALTPQMIRFFYNRLGDIIAVIHSRMKPGEKLYFFEKIKKNEAKVIIGPRSALFAPFSDLGAIIIDEEHDDSYKSNNKPRYNAKNFAVYLAKRERAVLVMGTATPSMEIFYNAEIKNIHLLELKKRYNNQVLPEIEILDLKSEKKYRDFYLTEKLVMEIERVLNKKEQVILFLNRRGFSSTVVCLSCGEPVYCPNCSIPLTFHKKNNLLSCHYCNFTMEPIRTCPKCNEKKLDYRGIGTEKVEMILKERFSCFSIDRFDADSVKTQGGHESILEKFNSGKIDVLIGTQMISKGHHFPRVTLVGIINADIFLNFPDFRANEKTYQTLIQVSGRAGRGDIPGKVFVQTLRPDHYAIEMIKTHDYEKFYHEEIRNRQILLYPPFSRILRIVVRAEDKEAAKKYIQKISLFLISLQSRIGKNKRGFQIIGPSPAPLEKIDKNFRYHLFIKSNQYSVLKFFGEEIQKEFSNTKNCFLEIDMDPISLL